MQALDEQPDLKSTVDITNLGNTLLDSVVDAVPDQSEFPRSNSTSAAVTQQPEDPQLSPGNNPSAASLAQQLDSEASMSLTTLTTPQEPSAATVIQSLSADMHAAMQQLLAAAPIRDNSCVSRHDQDGLHAAHSTAQQSHDADTIARQAASQLHTSDTDASLLAEPLVGSSQKLGVSETAEALPQGLSQQAPMTDCRADAQPMLRPYPQPNQQQPCLQHTQQQQGSAGTHQGHRAPWGSFHLPKEAVTPQSAEGIDRGLSGMELHLIHQLEGLERSVQRVEEQVSSNKQTRRLLKAVSTPVQVSWLPVNPWS